MKARSLLFIREGLLPCLIRRMKKEFRFEYKKNEE